MMRGSSTVGTGRDVRRAKQPIDVRGAATVCRGAVSKKHINVAFLHSRLTGARSQKERDRHRHARGVRSNTPERPTLFHEWTLKSPPFSGISSQVLFLRGVVMPRLSPLRAASKRDRTKARLLQKSCAASPASSESER
jgi:hypothetical protein